MIVIDEIKIENLDPESMTYRVLQEIMKATPGHPSRENQIRVDRLERLVLTLAMEVDKQKDKIETLSVLNGC